MSRGVLSTLLEAAAVLTLAVVIWGLSGSVWWALLPVAAYLGLVSFLIGGGKS